MTNEEYLLQKIKELEEENRRLKGEKPGKTKREKQAKGKACRALTDEEYKEFIKLMKEGRPGCGFRGNPAVAMALSVEASTGLRISDVLQLKPSSIEQYDGEWHFSGVIEKKTGKPRDFVVQEYVADKIRLYCNDNGIKGDELIFPFKERNVQARIQAVADFLGLRNVSTHSFRKYFATRIYNENGRDIELVRQVMQHASIDTTQKYLGVAKERVNDAIRNHHVEF